MSIWKVVHVGMYSKQIPNVLAVNLCCHFVGLAWLPITQLLPVDDTIRGVLIIYAAIPAGLNMTSNFFIFWWRSADYRNAFKSILKLHSNRVTP